MLPFFNSRHADPETDGCLLSTLKFGSSCRTESPKTRELSARYAVANPMSSSAGDQPPFALEAIQEASPDQQKSRVCPG